MSDRTSEDPRHFVQTVYRRVATFPEVSNYGDRHGVGIYEVKRVVEVHRQNGPDVWGYGGSGPYRWAADRQGRIYYLPYHGDNGSLWTRDDDTHWSNRPYERHARDVGLRPLTGVTPALADS